MADSYPGLSPADIATEALRKIRAISAYETAAESGFLDTALSHLAMIIDSVAGNTTCWWLVSDTIWFTLTADTWSYDLTDALGTSLPSDGVQWIVQAMVRPVGSTGSPDPVKIVRRDEIEELPTQQNGTPTMAYLDRSTNKQLRLDCAPGSGSASLELGLVCQRYAPALKTEDASVPTGFTRAWNRWLVNELACELGDGPITSVEMERLRSWKDHGTMMMAELMGGNAQQRVSTPPIVEPHPF